MLTVHARNGKGTSMSCCLPPYHPNSATGNGLKKATIEYVHPCTTTKVDACISSPIWLQRLFVFGSMGAPILMVLEGISDEFAGQDVAAKYVSLFSSVVVVPTSGAQIWMYQHQQAQT